jgi:O-antigen/teichoic acid export membrane protein
VASILSARLLGPAGRGELTAWALTASLGALVLIGPLPTGFGRAVLARDSRWVTAASLAHGLAVALLVWPLVVIGTVLGLSTPALIYTVLIAIPAGVVIYNLLVAFQAAKKAWSYQATRIVGPTVLAIGLLAFWTSGIEVSVNAALSLIAGGSVASLGVAAILGSRTFGLERRGLAVLRTRARASWTLGRGSYSATLLDVLLLRLDQFVVLAVSGEAALGLYVVAVNWAEIGQYLGHSIGQAAFEDEATLTDNEARRLLSRAAGAVAALTGVVVLAGFLLIGPIFGAAFESARWASLLLGPGIVARTVGYAGGQIMIARGYASAFARLSLVSLAFAGPAWAVGAWIFGIEGAAAASSAVYALEMILVLRSLRPRTL